MRVLAFVTVVLAGCDVGSVKTGAGSADAAGAVDSPPVLIDAPPAAAMSMSSTFTTTTSGGQYMPNNIVAVWVEDSNGTFEKTIGRWAGVRVSNLLAWNMKSGGDADAVSGATRTNHNNPLTVTWDLKDKSGNVVPDGTYTIRMELADQNATATTDNNQGTFTFVKGTSPQMQTALSNGGFQNVSIDFQP